jgi:deoxyribodipyrimidine photo-lyase
MWFRRDLRVQDNTALHEAARAADQGVVGVFLITPGQWVRHDDAPCKVRFWLDNLRELSSSLAKMNIPLLLEEVNTFRAVPKTLADIADRVNAKTVFFNREYEVNEQRRDEATTRRLSKRGIETYAFNDRVLLAPDAVKTKEGRFYTVFSPYRKAWLALAGPSSWKPIPKPRKQPETRIQSSTVPASIKGFDFGSVRPGLWPAGEQVARRRLAAFIAKKAEAYHEQRDFPAASGTSLLSPYLAAGVLSPRQCLRAALAANDGCLDGGNQGITNWVSELVWRDFYTHVMVGFPRVSMNRPFNLRTERVRWRHDRADLEAWTQGMTGYPLVDAAMRQLRQIGWMHNRLRMVAAMFLTKHLLVDWRLGEQHFMKHLIDGDLAANNGGWQWSASTGTDAAPYFRIFNPYSQSRKFDPQGIFIKRFCPELSGLSGKDLHDPTTLSPSQKSRLDYPKPIVDHKQARQRALRSFEAIKN